MSDDPLVPPIYTFVPAQSDHTKGLVCQFTIQVHTLELILVCHRSHPIFKMLGPITITLIGYPENEDTTP